MLPNWCCSAIAGVEVLRSGCDPPCLRGCQPFLPDPSQKGTSQKLARIKSWLRLQPGFPAH
eukprot:1194301-Prorocentrum_minimum.AAC.2